MCLVPLSKVDFPPYDGTTNAVKWLQKRDDYLEDHKDINDDAKIRHATFIST